ncbi:MAG: DUF2127 domain-containing protein [Candidatus Omnitrophica bacterium]|nr:DUF2127 domain-containing protein [Candidatus Omnitrophota bacterium]
MKWIREKTLHRLFIVGVWIKGFDGIMETVAGFIFLFVSRGTLISVLFSLTHPELMEDPDDWVANTLRHQFSQMSVGGKLFGGVYLLVHGLLKLFLVAGLLRGRLWSFPTGMIVLVAFIGYQAYRMLHHFSVGLAFLTVLDGLIIALIYNEYCHSKRNRLTISDEQSKEQTRKL